MDTYKIISEVLEEYLISYDSEGALKRIVTLITSLYPGSVAYILTILKKDRALTHLVSTKNINKSYKDLLKKIPIRANGTACSSAAFYQKKIIINKPHTYKAYHAIKPLIEKIGIKECWAFPIVNKTNHLLGTLSLYIVKKEEKKGTIEQLEQIVPFITLIMDHQKEATEKKRQNDLFNEIEKSTQSYTWEYNLKTKQVWWSKNSYNLLKIDPIKNGPTYNEFYKLLEKKSQKEMVRIVDKMVKTKQNQALEIAFKHLPNKTFYEEKKVICDKQGAPIKLVGTLKDITKEIILKKEKEEQEKKIEEERKVFDTIRNTLAPCITIKIKKSGNLEVTQYSKTLSKLFGIKFRKNKNILQEFRKIIHPHDLEMYDKKLEKINLLKKESQQSFRIIINKKIRYIKAVELTRKVGDTIELFSTFFDITNEKKLEREKINLANQLQTLTNNIPGMVYSFKITKNNQTSLLDCNNYVYDIYEVTKKDALKDVTLLFNQTKESYKESLGKAIETSRKTLTLFDFECEIKTPSGKEKWTACQAWPKKQVDNSVIWSGIILDTTEKNKIRIEKEQLSSELESINRHFVQSQESSLTGSWEWDIQKDKIWWSDETYKIFEINKILFKKDYESYLDLLEVKSKKRVTKAVKLILKDGISYSHIVQLKSDKDKYIQQQGYLIKDEEGNNQKLLGIVKDITQEHQSQQQKKALHDQLKKSREKRQQLYQKIIDTQDNERKRLARDIHDDLGQQLAYVKIKLELAKKKTNEKVNGVDQKKRIINGRKSSEKNSLKELNECIDQVQKAIHTSRGIATQLRPPQLDLLNLKSLIEDHINQIRHPNIQLESHLMLTENTITTYMKETIFRIVKEGIENAIKHGNPKVIVIRVTEENRKVEICIEDNGRGFKDNDRIKPGSFGLIGIEEQLAPINGHFTLKCEKKGTQLQAWIPK